MDVWQLPIMFQWTWGSFSLWSIGHESAFYCVPMDMGQLSIMFQLTWDCFSLCSNGHGAAFFMFQWTWGSFSLCSSGHGSAFLSVQMDMEQLSIIFLWTWCSFSLCSNGHRAAFHFPVPSLNKTEWLIKASKWMVHFYLPISYQNQYKLP